MTTGRSVHVDRFKAVQVRGCLLVSHADTLENTINKNCKM